MISNFYIETDRPPTEYVAFIEKVSVPSRSCFLVEKSSFLSPSITQKFLEKFSLNEIRAFLQSQGEDGFDLDSFLPFFNQIIAQEGPGFFGYHATTMYHWVFNEIVKQVLKIPKEEEFYFLRAPTENCLQFSDVKTFLKTISEPVLSIEEKRRFITLFFLRPIGKLNIKYEDAQVDQIYEALLYYTNRTPKRNTAQEEIEAILITLVGGKTSTLKRWLELPFREEYWSNLSVEEHRFVVEILCPLNDVWKEQQKILIALSPALFSNYTVSTESSIHVFAKGKSIEFLGEQIEQKAAEFLTKYGYSKEITMEIFTYAASLFDLNQGVLLQFFDDPSYSHIDQVAYLCTNYGIPLQERKLSDFFLHFNPMQEVEKTENFPYISHPQLRLLIFKEDILNPVSWLKIKEYDLVPVEKKEKLRKFIGDKLFHNGTKT